MRDISTCVPAMAHAQVKDFSVVRARNAVTHFAPGCYESFLKPRTTFPNMFAAGDWVDERHGSFSQEKVSTGNYCICQLTKSVGCREHWRAFAWSCSTTSSDVL